ncbi:hypothetical protein L208DRAFT_1417131 [Tricholoma matsutake]|nr:hypothetical protein L208DRAFT_1417131 [Tricholoma matsutake 945]
MPINISTIFFFINALVCHAIRHVDVQATHTEGYKSRKEHRWGGNETLSNICPRKARTAKSLDQCLRRKYACDVQ